MRHLSISIFRCHPATSHRHLNNIREILWEDAKDTEVNLKTKIRANGGEFLLHSRYGILLIIVAWRWWIVIRLVLVASLWDSSAKAWVRGKGKRKEEEEEQWRRVFMWVCSFKWTWWVSWPENWWRRSASSTSTMFFVPHQWLCNMCKYSCGNLPSFDSGSRRDRDTSNRLSTRTDNQESFVVVHGVEPPGPRSAYKHGGCDGGKLTENRETPEHIRSTRFRRRRGDRNKKMFQQKLVIVIRTFLLFFLFQPSTTATLVAATTIDAGEYCENELFPIGSPVATPPQFLYLFIYSLVVSVANVTIQSESTVCLPGRRVLTSRAGAKLVCRVRRENLS